MTSVRHTLGYLFLLFVAIASVDAKPKAKPVSSYFNICSRSDQKKLNDCVKKSITDAKPIITKGIPALGLIPLDPLVIPRMELKQGEGSFSLNTILTNFTIHGLSEYNVDSVNMVFDKDNLTFDLGMTTPSMRLTANYKMSGQILVIPMMGKGTCEMNFTDITTVAHTVGRLVKRNGHEFIEIVSIKWDIAIGTGRLWFDNLFNGDKRLGDATNNFLNANPQEAFQAIKHLPEEAFGELFKDLSSHVYDAYSTDEMFLD